ncbi:MAG: hypothetical protein K8R36_07455, partial [Planctomycetales bacterium]|nr:hypothetical protein [Planctomycetales bacterium]
MSVANSQNRLELPDSLQQQLEAYKRLVWRIKLTEAACIAAFGVLLAYLIVFALDRIWDTPGAWRGIILATATVVAGCIPLALYRWVWRKRRLEQLARLISRRMPLLGDQLLGVIELVHSDGEVARSRALCEAAIRQTATETERCDLDKAVPSPRHRQWGFATTLPLVLAIGLLVVCGAAAGNTWMRFLAPWRDLDRYTFASLDKLPKQYVVPHGEPVMANLKLHDDSRWEPGQGKLYVGKQPAITAPLQEKNYPFAIAPQLVESPVFVRVGDFTQSVRLMPTIRPELTALTATYSLPKYLGRDGTQKKDGRGGSIAVVKGSRVGLSAAISRKLASAQVNGKPATTQESSIETEGMLVNATSQLEFRWEDELGLAGKEPFVLSVTARDDESPLVACEDLPRQKVLLETEQLAFTVRSQDDYGVKIVGFEWVGLNHSGLPTNVKGERILGAGGPDKEALELRGTFSARDLGIEPQSVQVRVFAEDYFPGRPRAYSLPCVFHILSPEEHAIWITEQLSKWHRHALEVRDREKQLFERNKQFRELTAKDLDRPENRRELEKQSHAERANGRRLNTLVNGGEDLVRQAMRNPQIGVGHLEKWAEMLQVLKDISGNRMPSVAELLKEASQSPLALNKDPKDDKAGNQNDQNNNDNNNADNKNNGNSKDGNGKNGGKNGG